MSSQLDTGRIAWWDAFKGVSIVLIVIGHVLGAMEFEGRIISTGVRAFADVMLLGGLAGFYVAAGVFLPRSSRRPFLQFVGTKTKTLLIPYVVWTLLQGGTESVLRRYVVPDRPFATLLKTLWYDPYWQFWFLYVLFFQSLIAWPLIRSGLPRWSWFATALVMSLVARRMTTGWSVADRAIADLIFVALGMSWGRRWEVSRARLPVCVALSAIGSAALACLLVWMNAKPSWNSVFLSVSGLAFIVLLTLSLDRGFPRLVATHLGRHSLAIFIGHVFVIGACKVFLSRVVPHAPAALILIVRCSFGVCVPLAVVYVWLQIYDYLPFTLIARVARRAASDGTHAVGT